MAKSIKLIINPDWNEIENVRLESSKFLKSNGLNSESVDALVMVISELIENGIKYMGFNNEINYDNGKTLDTSVNIKLNISKGEITIEVINPVDDTAQKHLKELDKTIQWIRGYQDPFEAYIEKLKEISKRPLKDMESGLGLVRIAYEGKAALDFFVEENNILNVSAIAEIS